MPLPLEREPATPAPAVRFAARLDVHGDRLAVATDGLELSYRELAARVDAAARQLGDTRRLVLIAASNDLESLVWYLGTLRAGHVALLVPPGHADSLADAYDPDVVLSPAGGAWQPDERRPGSTHDLHPDLALLMSTSGSTGSPKLVRLSHENLQSNAEAIAGYLGVRASDRSATTLPMHYCYGLSVVHSHLAVGAGLILTELSVVDACFWDLFRAHAGTSFAGVPHTFDLLDRVDFASMELPGLRYITQAGGRLDAERVRGYAQLGQQRGWDLFVMYGQTEATARMAYLPPDLAASHPHTVGVAIPGGSFSLERRADDPPGVGELVYDGPNVMLGYADTPADLSLGRNVTSLRTGDLARLTDAGLYEIVGRRARFVKVAGLRVDLQQLEAVLAGRGLISCCAGTDGRLAVAVEGGHDADEIWRFVMERCGLPGHAVDVRTVVEIPRLSTGKPDYQAVLALSERRPADPAVATAPAGDPARLRDLFAELLNRPDATEDDTFVELGGDSLSYVEMSVRLEHLLGQVPANWHTTPIRDLVPSPRRRLFGGRTAETSVLLRAAAIVAIVGTHAGLFSVLGGAHVLLAVAGFNFARFRLTSAGRLVRLRQQLGSIARIAVPSMVWIAAVVVVSGTYGIANIALLNGFLGSPTWDSRWHFWFVEILVYILLGLAALLSIPWADRLERRFPFGFALGLVAAGLLTRFEVVGLGVPHMLPALWLFALGWAMARATRVWQRLLLTAVVVATVPGFFGNPSREALMIGGLMLLLWTASVPSPALASRLAGLLASSSLYIYLIHWQVYPHLVGVDRGLAVVASLVAGAVAWLVVRAVQRRLMR
nr:AMP-binding protein [Phytoactinopolyspora alkaliphila]